MYVYDYDVYYYIALENGNFLKLLEQSSKIDLHFSTLYINVSTIHAAI